ncbi:kinase [Alteromonas sediminis]|uniref:Kinase n=1 Tax=Alteromonas sediminis TaxID=2259342 RepID=A0A3N5Y128_9ALTE|nr:kinase [Alteromonas sediminis]RPJ67477.1 kinase [Alteromonas sediminis]
MTIDAFLAKHQLDVNYQSFAQKWFNPLVHAIFEHHKSAEKPLYVGINGCQGSGKSTLADYLAMCLHEDYALQVVVCSLDDFYLPAESRQQLARTVHPLLSTRGVPGTHDVTLLEQVLLHCQQSTTLTPLANPRFDKASDNPFPRHQWPQITLPVDVVLFEGWCWGVRSQDSEALATPVNTLEQNKDTSGDWRRFVNTQLLHHYEPLYALMDLWVMLKAPSFDAVAQWREQQEAKLRASISSDKGTKVMSPEQVLQFIQHFQRLTEHGLKTLPAYCDWVYELDYNRDIHTLSGKLAGD